MVRRSVVGITTCVLLGAFAPVFALQDPAAAPEQPRAGAPAPEFNLFDLRGQVFVIEFLDPTDEEWAKLHKDARFGTDGKLKQVFDRYEEQGVVWLAVAPFERAAGAQQGSAGQGSQLQGLPKRDPAQLRRAVEDLDLEYPVLMDEGGAMMKAFGITQMPHLVVVDGQGTITYTDRIQVSGDQVVGLDTFERAIGTAINTTRAGSVPAGAPREPQQGGDPQGDQRRR